MIVQINITRMVHPTTTLYAGLKNLMVSNAFLVSIMKYMTYKPINPTANADKYAYKSLVYVAFYLLKKGSMENSVNIYRRKVTKSVNISVHKTAFGITNCFLLTTKSLLAIECTKTNQKKSSHDIKHDSTKLYPMSYIIVPGPGTP